MAELRWTYSGDPSSSSKDEVRFLVGDTTKSRPLLDDREILYQLGKTPNVRLAGAELLEAKAREFARKADVTVGDVSKAFSKVAEAMGKAADQLRQDATRLVKPFFGGLTKSGKRDLAAQEDDVQPAFAIGMTDDPAAVQLNRDYASLYELVGWYGG